MDPRKNMIIDLEKKGDKRMFVTEQVVQISENNNGLWAVEFSTSQRIFNYNKSRLEFPLESEPLFQNESEPLFQSKLSHLSNWKWASLPEPENYVVKHSLRS